MSRFTLIAYREEYEESYRCCTVGRTGSDLKIIHEIKIKPVIEKIIDFEEWNHNRGSNYDEYSLTLLRNGRKDNLLSFGNSAYNQSKHRSDSFWSLDDNDLDEMLCKEREARKALRAHEAEEARAASEQKARLSAEADADRRRQHDLAELARLQAQYGEVA